MFPSSADVEKFVVDAAARKTCAGTERSAKAIQCLATHLGLHRVARRQVVVGGTNGKGTTVAYLRQLLGMNNLCIGATTSPHLHDYLERITIDGVSVSGTECMDALRWVEQNSAQCRLTYFDLTTLAALRLFQQHAVDVALVEVGLGGRLDCANVLDSDVAILTNVDLDHRDRLGHTIEAISREKVPIARPGRPLVLADARENHVISEYADELEIPLFQFGLDFGIDSAGSIFVRLDGEEARFPMPQSLRNGVESFCAALQASVLLDVPLAQSRMKQARFSPPPGRFERIHSLGRNWILDVAHNPASIAFLKRALKTARIDEFVGVFGCFRDKDRDAMLTKLFESQQPNAATIRSLITTDTHGARASSARDVANTAAFFTTRCHAEPAMDSALRHAAKQTNVETPIVVFGSVDVVSRARRALNMPVLELAS